MNFPLESVLGVTGVALIGVLLAAWNKSRDILLKVFGFAVASVELEGVYMISAFMYKCWTEAKHSRLSQKHYETYMTYVKDLDKKQFVLFLTQSPSFTFWHKGLPLWVTTAKESSPNRGGTQTITVRYLRWAFDIEKFLIEAVNDLNKSNNDANQFWVRYQYGDRLKNKDLSEKAVHSEEVSAMTLLAVQPITHSRDNIGFPLRENSADRLVLTTQAQETLREIDYWYNSRTWFKDRGIAWKRGYLLAGPPGTGKTSFARAVAESLNVPMFIFDLASMSNQDLGSSWRGAAAYGRARVIVLEDLDNVFHGRENITAKNMASESCTFDCLLQLIDGADRMEGTLLFVTTNHPEHLDPAIGGGTSGVSERAGRVDRVLHFPYLTEAGAFIIAKRILGDVMGQAGLEAMAKQGVNIAAVNFQEVCFQKALSLRFNGSSKDHHVEQTLN